MIKSAGGVARLGSDIDVRLAADAVFIDLDGTLIDTAPDLGSALNRTLEELGHAPVSDDLVRMWIGHGAAVLVQHAMQEATAVAPDSHQHGTALARFLELYAANLCGRSKIYPGVEAVLAQLSAAGFRLACVTNKRQAMTVPLLEQIGLMPSFALVICGARQDRMKPEPGPLLHACERLEIGPQHCVLVGDSENDILAAQAAGMAVIWVTYGYNQGRDLAAMQPDATIDAFSTVADIVERAELAS